MVTYDVLIVGGGPAGLSAATTLVRQLHSVVIFDSREYRNAATHHMHNMTTWDHKEPADFRAAARQDLTARYNDVHFEDAEVASINEVGTEFEAKTVKGDIFRGRKLILATGVADIFPDIEGFADCWSKAIFHCLFCHGYEERKRGVHAGVLAVDLCANPMHALQLGRNSAQLCGKSTIFTNGSEAVAQDIREALANDPKINVDSRKIRKFALAPAEAGVEVHFEDGPSEVLAFVAHSTRTQLRSNLAQQLGLEVAGPVGDIKVSPPFMQTSKRGVFAAGDNMTMVKAVASAVYNGSSAGVAASTQLLAEQHGHKPMF